MLKKVLKWTGIALGSLLGLIVLSAIGLLIYGQAKFKQADEDRPVLEIIANTTAEGVARGEYLVRKVMACVVCHGPGGEGQLDYEAPLIGRYAEFSQGLFSGVFSTPNLTPDDETGLGRWTDGQIARAIREGLDKDGVELIVMPEYANMSDSDVAAVVGYLRSREPAHNEIPPFSVNAVGKALALGLFDPPEPEIPIVAAATPPPDGTAEYGEYLARLSGCVFCHGENLAGGPMPFGGADEPPAANLTPAGKLSDWSEEDFITAVREGVTPTGRELHEAMPRRQLTDKDLRAIFQFLRTLPTLEIPE